MDVLIVKPDVEGSCMAKILIAEDEIQINDLILNRLQNRITSKKL